MKIYFFIFLFLLLSSIYCRTYEECIEALRQCINNCIPSGRYRGQCFNSCEEVFICDKLKNE